MRLVLGLVLCLLAATAPPARAADAPVILVVGDSLSSSYGLKPGQGWVSLLQQRLRKEGYGHRVVNASVTGETTDGGVERIDRALAKHRPAVVIIELGGNDGLRGLPVSRMQKNLDTLITRSLGAKARVLLLSIRIPTNYGPQYGNSFQQVYRDLAASRKVASAALLGDALALNNAYFQADGIHPNAKAQPLLLNNVWGSLAPLLRP